MVTGYNRVFTRVSPKKKWLQKWLQSGYKSGYKYKNRKMKIDKEAKHRFEYMAATICDKYCRYPLIWNEEAFGPLAESKKCAECPLTMFEQYVEVDNSCDDVVSRQWLMRKATERFYTTNYFNHITKMIEEAPSVRPQEPQESKEGGEQ